MLNQATRGTMPLANLREAYAQTTDRTHYSWLSFTLSRRRHLRQPWAALRCPPPHRFRPWGRCTIPSPPGLPLSAFSMYGSSFDLFDVPSGSFTVALYADSGSATPGTQLATIGTLNDTDLSDTLTAYHFALTYPLAATTRYWIGLSTDDGSTAEWSWSSDISGTGVAGEYNKTAYRSFPQFFHGGTLSDAARRWQHPRASQSPDDGRGAPGARTPSPQEDRVEPPRYSCRSATIGSTRIARRAGT